MIDLAAELDGQKFGAIVSDPPWAFSTWSKKNQTRAAENHYDLLTLKQIKELPVADIAADDCALFLWAINPMLPQALEVIESWGFTFKTVALTWAKRTPQDTAWHFGLGYWGRQNTEQCLLATRGKPKRIGKGVRQLMIAPRRQHSRKPDETYSRVEQLVGGPYLDMFSRQPREGWANWGVEADKFRRQDGKDARDGLDLPLFSPIFSAQPQPPGVSDEHSDRGG